MIDMIFAMDNNRGLGLDNKLLYQNKDDMKFFKETSMRYDYVVCGRKTYESIGQLKDRKMIVLTRNKDYDTKSKFAKAMTLEKFAEFATGKDILCIGGAEIYEAVLPATENVFLTLINDSKDADAYISDDFMKDLFAQFNMKLLDSYSKDENNETNFLILQYTRK